MLSRQIDLRVHALNPIPISYLVQTANEFVCEIYVISDRGAANLKSYNELKNLDTLGNVTFCFEGSDESEAEDRIHQLLWQKSE
jgi:phosphotransferase system HPr-like phosphotransfer protein